jgi:NAD+ diphosphatase
MSNQITLNLPLAEVALDRDYLSRTREKLFEELWLNSQTKVLVMFDQQVLLADGSALKYLEPSQVSLEGNPVYLGKTLTDDAPVVMLIIESDAALTLEPDETRWHHLRKSGIGLSSTDAAIFTQALALANWHELHAFCASCGENTTVTQAGWVRRCESENRELFPRTDPAIIVGVIDDQDRILLGSQGIWKENQYSILAGFVEPGESLEAAVIREMYEEAGIVVRDPQFIGSQAWPFPYSLMLGYLAKFSGGEAIPDGEEIVKLRWFSKQELKDEADSLLLPGKLSIARSIIEHWLGEELNGQDH